MKYTCYASCAFGIEGVLAEELRRLEFEDVTAQDARVYFLADERGIARANIFLRTADRIYIVLKEFDAITFDELFEGVKKIEFSALLSVDARFPVNANAVRSELMSVSDVQSVSKKAVVRSLEKAYGIKRFEESGNVYGIYINIYKNKVTVALNTSGTGLNRRGYRLKNVQAPLKETLAAAMILISRWYSRDFYDPMCGSGTIAIEAAMMAANMAPGIKQRFDAQGYNGSFKKAFAEMRELALDTLITPAAKVFASDVDGKSIKLAKEHAHNMDVSEYIQFSTKPLSKFEQPENPSSIICNPPYAVRLGERKEVEKLYREMGRLFTSLRDAKIFVLCADDHFEKLYAKKADKKRKLYNGNLKCTYYQYFRNEK